VFILVSTGMALVISGLSVAFAGLIVYFIKAKVNREWPFELAPKI